MKTTAPLTAYFQKRSAEDDLPTTSKKVALEPSLALCSGLTDASWPRNSSFKITDCIEGSPNRYHGGRHLHEIQHELFPGLALTDLTKAQKEQLYATKMNESTWQIERYHGIDAIFSTKCLGKTNHDPQIDHPICSECNKVRSDKTLISAISKEYAVGENVKYTRTDHMEQDAGHKLRQKYEEVKSLLLSLEKAANRNDDFAFWDQFSHHAKNGAFKDHEAFNGLCRAVSSRIWREENGKALSGVRFAPAFDSFCMTLAASSTQGYNLFRENFAGRSSRSMRQIRQKTGMHLLDGFAKENFDRIATELANLGYQGPVSVGTDETVCIQTLRVRNGVIVGAQGGDIAFETNEELKSIVGDIIHQKALCSKVSFFKGSFRIPCTN